MRRGLLLILFAVAALAVSGDTRSGQIMARMASVIKGHGQYEVKFTFKADPSADPLQGRYVVSGDKYYLLVAGTEVFCDGKAKYEINTQYKEVTVDRVDPTDRRVLTNPAKVVDFPEQEFCHNHTG